MPPEQTGKIPVSPVPKANIQIDLAGMSDDDLFFLRAALDVEMRKRQMAFSVGGVGERLAIEFFKANPKLPNLQPAPRGTKNVDALSRNGDRYSIKTYCNAKKTGTIYPDPNDKEKQLFEYLLIVRLGPDWMLRSIHQLSWHTFVKIRSWDSRMNAWYVGISNRTLGAATVVWKLQRADAETERHEPDAHQFGNTAL
jgi:hypothetical protein